MAIKPNDCIIKLQDLVIGYNSVVDSFGHPIKIERVEPYWARFIEHVKNTTDWQSEWQAYDRNFERQLAKFNATYKQTKRWDDRYIKFKTHSDLTFFVLKWS